MNKIVLLIAGIIILAAAGWFVWQNWLVAPQSLRVVETLTQEEADQTLEQKTSTSGAADETIKQIDQEFSQLDETDFNTDDLSDQALEL